MQYRDFLLPHFFLVTFQVGDLQVSAQTEQSAMGSAESRKSASGTRNGNAYFGGTHISGFRVDTKRVHQVPLSIRVPTVFGTWIRMTFMK